MWRIDNRQNRSRNNKINRKKENKRKRKNKKKHHLKVGFQDSIGQTF